MSWSALQILVLAVGGLSAGAINAVAGGGSLITFPILVLTGLPALTANLTNTVAQCPGYVSIVHGYLPELAGQGSRLRRLVPLALFGGAIGIALLKLGSQATFRAVVPGLILLACALLALQPRLARRLARGERHARQSRLLGPAVVFAGAYAAYFGAAAGVLLLGILAVLVLDSLQRLNALNRLLIMCVNLAAAVVFCVLGPINWVAVAILGPTTLVGGRAGVLLARRLDDRILRAVVLLFGVASAVYLAASA